MGNIRIAFITDNAAFDENPNTEISRILRECADSIENGRMPVSITDVNGNKIGTIEYHEEN